MKKIILSAALIALLASCGKSYVVVKFYCPGNNTHHSAFTDARLPVGHQFMYLGHKAIVE